MGSAVRYTRAIVLSRKSDVSSSSNGASLASTSAPGRHTNRRPMTFGCKVRMKTATRHSGIPQATSRSQNCVNTCCGFGADRAPPITHSSTALISSLGIAAESIVSTSKLILRVSRQYGERYDDRGDPGRAAALGATRSGRVCQRILMNANLLEGMEHEEAARLAGLSRLAAYEWHNLSSLQWHRVMGV